MSGDRTEEECVAEEEEREMWDRLYVALAGDPSTNGADWSEIATLADDALDIWRKRRPHKDVS